jgi:hypothetical protein
MSDKTLKSDITERLQELSQGVAKLSRIGDIAAEAYYTTFNEQDDGVKTEIRFTDCIEAAAQAVSDYVRKQCDAERALLALELDRSQKKLRLACEELDQLMAPSQREDSPTPASELARIAFAAYYEQAKSMSLDGPTAMERAAQAVADHERAKLGFQMNKLAAELDRTKTALAFVRATQQKVTVTTPVPRFKAGDTLYWIVDDMLCRGTVTYASLCLDTVRYGVDDCDEVEDKDAMTLEQATKWLNT